MRSSACTMGSTLRGTDGFALDRRLGIDTGSESAERDVIKCFAWLECRFVPSDGDWSDECSDGRGVLASNLNLLFSTEDHTSAVAQARAASRLSRGNPNHVQA
jgi:hypothetical protein